ncbi:MULTISPECIES: histidine phosphatase family protein [unclassified Microbacterium]|uniref:histidine phosphatase family protein n=1 Tax=unclassified Microbacterium TaxID=2609290 RepID=UPI00386C636F
MTTLTLVRHGETDWNLHRRIQGSTDIPLNDTGRAQARAAALEIAELPRDHDVPVFLASSDLSRARETAEIIGEVLGIEGPRTYPALRERAYGDAEGVTDTEFLDRWGPWNTAVIPNAEEWDAVTVRAIDGIRRLVADARRATAPRAPEIIVVAHGGLIRAVLRHATAGAFPEDGVKLRNGSRHTLLVERDRLRVIASAVVPV